MLGRSNMKLTYLFLSLIFFAGCAANYKPPVVTPAGSKVNVTEKQPHRCVYLGELTGYNMRFEWSHDVYNMREKMQSAFNNTLRNKVAEMKGNTAVLLMRSHDAGMYTYVYAVQRCKA